jgi:integrase
VQSKQTNKPSLELSAKTYADLEVAYTAHLKSENKSEQDINNFRSNLNSWRGFFKAEKSTEIRLHFGEKFSVSLEKYKKNQLNNQSKDSTVASKASKLKKLNEFLIAREFLANLSPKFGERLQQLLRNAGFESNNKFWSLYLREKCSDSAFRDWCQGEKSPRRDSIELVGEIERLLNVPTETLTCLLRSTHSQKKGVRRQTANGIRMSVVRQQPYLVWEKYLEEEFQDLVKFKSGPVKRSGVKRYRNAEWTTSEGGKLGTAELNKTNLQSFFGYLCLPIESSDLTLCGKGYSKKKLTLGLLADKELVEDFITEFKKLRSFDKYNNGHILFLNIVTSLLRPESGYLYLNPQFALKIGLSGNLKEWQEKCVDTRNRLLEIAKDIQYAKDSGSNDFRKGRDPKEPIVDILALPNPLIALTDLLGVMLSDLDTYSSGTRKAVFFRDILLIALLIANPLRIRMFSIMKFDRNLIRKDDGSWWISFKREDFKNRKSIASDYEVLVVPELIPLIERYKKEFRPLLFGAEESDYVFLRESSPRAEKPKAKKLKAKKPKSLIYKVKHILENIYILTPKVLSERISIQTKKYMPLSPGFRTHAFRHIVATSIIKSNPENGFFLASKVLHDKLETVEENYSHLKTHEFFEPYNRFLSGFLKGIIGNDNGGASSSENDGGGK